MGQVISSPEMRISDDASEAQRNALLEFNTVALNINPDLIEATLEVRAQTSNLAHKRKITSKNLIVIYDVLTRILDTQAYLAIDGFDPQTEHTIETDDSIKSLILQKNAAAARQRQAGSLLRNSSENDQIERLKKQEEALRDKIVQRQLVLYAGRLALGGNTQTELAQPA